MEGKIIIKTERVVKGNPHAAPKEEMTQKVAQFQDMVGVEPSKSSVPTQDLIHYSKNSKMNKGVFAGFKFLRHSARTPSTSRRCRQRDAPVQFPLTQRRPGPRELTRERMSEGAIE